MPNRGKIGASKNYGALHSFKGEVQKRGIPTLSRFGWYQVGDRNLSLTSLKNSHFQSHRISTSDYSFFLGAC